jgi:hypothetical protein
MDKVGAVRHNLRRADYRNAGAVTVKQRPFAGSDIAAEM